MDNIHSIIKVSGGFIGVGSTTSFGSGNADAYVLKFDEEGELVWSKTFGDWNDQVAYSIKSTKDNGFILAGYSTSPDSYAIDEYGRITNDKDIYLIKIGADGNLQWSKSYNSTAAEYAAEVEETPDGDFVIAATSKGVYGRDHIYLVKVNKLGVFLWSKKIANSFFAIASSMRIASDNSIILCNAASGSANIIKLNKEGDLLWSKVAKINAWGTGLTLTSDNALVFSGGRDLTKMNMNGELIWSSTFENGVGQYLKTVAQLDDGTFVMTGILDTASYYSYGQINLTKTDANGLTNCSQSISPEILNEPITYLTHTTTSFHLGKQSNASTIHYGYSYQSHSICRSAKEVVSVNELPDVAGIRIFPNPTNGILNLEIPSSVTNLKINIYDVSGRSIYSQKIKGQNIWQIDLSSKAKGVYFLEYTIDSKKEVKKLIIY
jgi:hypothetical protein